MEVDTNIDHSLIDAVTTELSIYFKEWDYGKPKVIAYFLNSNGCAEFFLKHYFEGDDFGSSETLYSFYIRVMNKNGSHSMSKSKLKRLVNKDNADEWLDTNKSKLKVIDLHCLESYHRNRIFELIRKRDTYIRTAECLDRGIKELMGSWIFPVCDR